MVAFANPNPKAAGLDTRNNTEVQTETAPDVSLAESTISSGTSRYELVAPESGFLKTKRDQTLASAQALRMESAAIGAVLGGDGLIGRGIAEAGDAVAGLQEGVINKVAGVDQAVRGKINDVATAVSNTIDTVDRTIDQMVDGTIQAGREVKDFVLDSASQAKSAVIEAAKSTVEYVVNAPDRIFGWISEKITGMGTAIKDQMIETSKDLGGTGLIAQAGISLANSVETGIHNLAKVIDQTDEIFVYVASGDLIEDAGKITINSLAKAHREVAESFSSLSERVANFSDFVTDATLGVISKEIREHTQSLARLTKEAGQFLAGDGILSQPFNKAAELYLGYGEQVAGSLDTFHQMCDSPTQDFAANVQRWKVWGEMMHKKTEAFNYEYQQIASAIKVQDPIIAQLE